jgi:nitrite reductase/ring-hydroxylating ferredoxin subunit
VSLTTARVLLCRRADLGSRPRRFEVDGGRIVVVALGDELIALDDTCTHENASLAEEGEVDSDTREIECCRHGARFSLDDGSAALLPATTGLRIPCLVVEGDDVYVELTE